MAYASWSVVFGEQPSAAKWNILGTNDAHFYSFLGDNLAWQTWSPTWTNLTIGNGANTYAKYNVVGKTVFFKLKLTFGGTTSISGEPTFSLPVNFNSDYTTASSDTIASTVLLRDDSTNTRQQGVLLWGSASTIIVRYMASSEVYTPISPYSPFTWATSDVMTISGFYEGV